MSIVTKGGDQGQTSLMYGRRVSKCHPRVEACGAVDELNAAMGVARAWAKDPHVRDLILAMQKQLVPLMGELATADEDFQRYKKDGYSNTGAEFTQEIEKAIRKIEAEGAGFQGWAMPGETPAAAALDLARTVCRRSERAVCALTENGELRNPEILVCLNRLSDLLWLLARKAEAPPLNASERGHSCPP